VTGAWRRYEPRDPCDGVTWFEGMVHQCEWDYDEQGRRRHRADLPVTVEYDPAAIAEDG
jgi:hypothetical protein